MRMTATGFRAATPESRDGSAFKVLQSTDRTVAHAVGAGDVNQGLARISPRKSLLTLVRRQLRRPSHMDTTGLSSGSSFTCARTDQFAFELRQAAEHRQDQSAMRRARVRPRVGQRPEARPGPADGV